MKGQAIPYSADELAWLEANRTLPISDYTQAFCDAFRRDVSAQNLHALRKRNGWRTGRTGQFEKDAAPHNKGKTCAPGQGGRHPNAARTHFKTGERRGVAVRLYQPIGTERITKDGYRERKIHDGMPLQSRWKAVHRIEWEAVNGAVPANHALKCLGDKSDCSPSNWVLVSRALLPRLAGGAHGQYMAFDGAAEELKPALLAIAKLDHKARSTRSKVTA